MDKYIIDGIEYSYGDIVEVSDDGKEWKISKIVGVDNSRNYPIITEEHGNFLKVRKIQPKTNKQKVVDYLYSELKKGAEIEKITDVLAEMFYNIYKTNLSGRKAKLILEDGTEYSVTVE